MKYSEFLQNLIGKEGSLDEGETNYFFNLIVFKEDINHRIIEVGDDYVIFEKYSGGIKISSITIPLNLLVILGEF